MANTTKTNVESAPDSVQQIYKAWDGFCEWYSDKQNHERGDTPTKWSKNVSVFYKYGQYPRPERVLQALEETGIAKITLSFQFDFFTTIEIDPALTSVDKIYKAWETFCEWYGNKQNHKRGETPLKYSSNVTRFKSKNRYPGSTQILRAIEENNVAKIKLKIAFTY